MFRSVITIALIFVLSLSSAYLHAQNWEKYLEKFDDYYQEGDYKNALKTNEKFKAKSTKKLGSSNPYIPKIFLNKAKLNFFAGKHNLIESDIASAILASEVQYEANSSELISILLESTYLLIGVGQYDKADSLLNMIDEVATEKQALSLIDNAQSLTLHATILLEKGFYIETIEYIRENKEFFKKNIGFESGSKQEKLLFEKYWCHLINLSGKALLERGSLQSADSALKINRSYLKKVVGTKDAIYGEHLLLLGEIEFKRKNYKEASKLFSSAYSATTSQLKEQSPEALEIQERILNMLLFMEKKGPFLSEYSKYKSIISRNFGKESIYFVKAEVLNINYLLVMGDSEGFIKNARQYINSPTMTEYHPYKVEILQTLHRLALRQNMLKIGQQSLTYILANKRHVYGSESPQYHLSRMELAHFNLLYTNELDEVDSIINTSWKTNLRHELDIAHSDYLSIQNTLASYYEETDQYKLAEDAVENAMKATLLIYDREDIDFAVQLIKMADLNIRIGEFYNASKYIALAIEKLDKYKNDEKLASQYISALNTQATLLHIQGDFDAAERRIIDANKLIEKKKLNKSTLILKKSDLANIYLSMGLYADAETLLVEDIEAISAEFSDQNKRLVAPYLRMGKLHLLLGDYTLAEQYTTKSMNLAMKIYGENSTKMVACFSQLADVDQTLGDYETAEKRLRHAIDINVSKLGKYHFYNAELYSKLGLALLYQSKDYEETARLFNEAKEIYLDELSNENPLYADMLKKSAYVKIVNKEYGEAFQSLLEAEKIWQSKTGKRNNINSAEIYVLLGDIYYLLLNFEESESNYIKAQRIFSRYFSKHHPDYVKTLAKLSKVEFMRKDYRSALKQIEEVLENYDYYIQNYFPSLSEREKAQFWNSIKDEYEYYNTLVLNKARSNDDKEIGKIYDNALRTKALLLNTSIKLRKSIQNSSDPELKKIFAEWIHSKELFTKIGSMSEEQKLVSGFNADSLSNRIESLEKELSAKSDLFSQSSQEAAITWKDVKSVLKPNEIAVEIIRFRVFDHHFTDSVYYGALILKGDKESPRPEIVLLKNGEELENRGFKLYKNSIIYSYPDEHSYANYWKPVEEKLPKSATVFLSPDGVYNQINLEAIPTPDGRYVLDNSNIILLSNTKDLYKRRTRRYTARVENRALMFGNPEFYVSNETSVNADKPSINPLPGTKKEIHSLGELLDDYGWKTDFYTELDASEDRVKALDNPRIFHIATHGFYAPKAEPTNEIEIAELKGNDANDNPLLRSGLMLKGAGDVLTLSNYNYNIKNGILTAYEAMSLNLDYTDLVVLSACETGLGDIKSGEGVYGLRRAFLVAGAKILVMSLFKVSDEATNDLMVNFYKKWLDSGELRNSFVAAKKEIRDKYQDPLYWGSFIMFGLE